jgi:1,4-alpha-glucan branching enzyme
VRDRLIDIAAARNRPGVVVVGYDTELFGHWWHEGPAFLEAVLRQLPAAGVRVTTLHGAVETGAVAGRARPASGSWGSGKDWHVWAGEQVADLLDGARDVQQRLLRVVDKSLDGAAPQRHPELDALMQQAFLTTSSDWAFMVTKDSAGPYARDRAHQHAARFHTLASRIESGRDGTRQVEETAREDAVFGHLDARRL